jgi:4-hydroxy-3-methylbut-2-enyl diphosphate reductase
MGMCFGVRDAIALAKQQSTHGPLTILGDLVHNDIVLDDLRRRGIRIEHHTDRASTPTVMITAHGASDKRIEDIRARGHNVLEATCPLVHFAHRSLRKLVADGFHPIIIGKWDHVEVRGMTEDLQDFEVVLCEADIARLVCRVRFGVVAQTTQPIDKVQRLVSLLRQRFPAAEVRFVDTVCQPTKQRQSSAVHMARQSDVVIVIGGAHSNNTRELVSTCGIYCARVHHVQTVADLSPHWFFEDDTVGITAGTSTPDNVINDVEQAITALFPVSAPITRP